MLNIKKSKNSLTWDFEGKLLENAFDTTISSVLELADASGFVVILEPSNRCEMNDAYIINANGSVRTKISIPQDIGNIRAIYDVYYEGLHKLAFILVTNSALDVACIFNEAGKFLGSHLSK